MRCSECGREIPADRALTVDDRPICRECLHPGVDPIPFWPIGVVANDRDRPDDGFGVTGSDRSEIRLLPTMARFVAGLADETHLTVVWIPHRARPVRTRFARGWDGRMVGPFASRTPDRPTPIAVTDVELVAVDGTTLQVRGLDAIDGTPVLDLKVAPAGLKRRKRDG